MIESLIEAEMTMGMDKWRPWQVSPRRKGLRDETEPEETGREFSRTFPFRWNRKALQTLTRHIICAVTRRTRVIWRDHIFVAPCDAFWASQKTNKNIKNINGGEQQLSNTKTKKTRSFSIKVKKNRRSKRKRTGFKSKSGNSGPEQERRKSWTATCW